jgi:hypothetical protein
MQGIMMANKSYHILKIETPRGAIEVIATKNTDFQEFMDWSLSPYNFLRATQEPELDALIEIHDGMVADWKVVDWDGLNPDWAAMIDTK